MNWSLMNCSLNNWNVSNTADIKIGKDEFIDISCVALNKLPAKSVRFTIDTTFYSTPEELRKMSEDVSNVVKYASNFILEKVWK